MKLRFASIAKKLSFFFNASLLLAALAIAVIFFPGNDKVLPDNDKVSPDNGNVFIGAAGVSDGDSLRFGDERVRLIGIDAPELAQTCTDSAGQSWACGRVARQRLVQLVAGGNLECRYSKRDRYDRALAVCRVDEKDIGAILVSEGLAVSYNDYPSEEAIARRQKLGMWAGEFITPRNWRRGQR